MRFGSRVKTTVLGPLPLVVPRPCEAPRQLPELCCGAPFLRDESRVLGWTLSPSVCKSKVDFCAPDSSRERQTERDRERQRQTETDRQTDRQTDGRTRALGRVRSNTANVQTHVPLFLSLLTFLVTPCLSHHLTPATSVEPSMYVYNSSTPTKTSRFSPSSLPCL